MQRKLKDTVENSFWKRVFESVLYIIQHFRPYNIRDVKI